MDVRVLGPLTVAHHDRNAVPSARKPRKVLSLLLLNESEVVSTGALIRELWGARPPVSMLTTLQTYVLQVRKRLSMALGISLAEVARSTLVTRNGGYLLVLPDAAVDLRLYRSLERKGMRFLDDRDDESAVRTFNQALALWRGGALVDVELGPVLEPMVAGFEQSRMTMLELRFDAELRRGRHRASLSELASLSAQHSYNENLHAQYMLALHRSGCRSKALDVYRRHRELMISEQGLEPSAGLQRLHQALLAGAPALDRPGTSWAAE